MQSNALGLCGVSMKARRLRTYEKGNNFYGDIIHLAEYPPCKRDVDGAEPSVSTIIKILRDKCF